MADAYASMYEKKEECKDGYHYDKDEKKCVKDKSRGMAHGYMSGHHHHDDDNEGESNGGGTGGEGGGGDGGGGGE